jgi:hypothetical protein
MYYECHITIEPVFNDWRRAILTEICANYGFKPAKLLMQRDRNDTPVRSDKDTFCTGHSKSFDEIKNRMLCLSQDLRKNKFKVWRMKIEHILFDERSKE